jgi:hypothetical protein
VRDLNGARAVGLHHVDVRVLRRLVLAVRATVIIASAQERMPVPSGDQAGDAPSPLDGVSCVSLPLATSIVQISGTAGSVESAMCVNAIVRPPGDLAGPPARPVAVSTRTFAPDASAVAILVPPL